MLPQGYVRIYIEKCEDENKRLLFITADKESIDSNKTIFCAIFVMNKLLNSPAIFNPFINDLVRLLDEHKNVELSQIGFPENWIEILQSVYT